MVFETVQPSGEIDTQIVLRSEDGVGSVAVGNTDVKIAFNKAEYEFSFVPSDNTKRVEGPRAMVKLSIGLLGLYEWANQDGNKAIFAGKRSVYGLTTHDFVNQMARLLDKGNHADLVGGSPDGGENANMNFNVERFVNLPPDDLLIQYFQRVRKRESNVY